MISIHSLRLSCEHSDGTLITEERLIRTKLAHALTISADSITTLKLRKRSIDARKKTHVTLLFSCDIALQEGELTERQLCQTLAKRHKNLGFTLEFKSGEPKVYQPKECLSKTSQPKQRPDQDPSPIAPHIHLTPNTQPLVVGAGSAGLFCALELAQQGLCPILIERGDSVRERIKAIEHHNKTGELDPESNVQFGAGGAGTFSDGKLQTGTKSPLHAQILTTFVDAGAPQTILWDAKPHIGTDILCTVVENILQTIEALGGEVRMRTTLTQLAFNDLNNHGLTAAELKTLDTTERISASHVVLATGHSARDVYEMLAAQQVALERKTFAVGARIEHLQSNINRALYGSFAQHPALGAAPYKLSCKTNTGRQAFSFCMCPGGYVVCAASEPGGVVTNGMSYSDRAGVNANAGLLANIFPEDLPGDHVLAGMYLQRQLEQAAFEIGGGAYRAPAQLVGDFLQHAPSTAPGSVVPTYPRDVAWGSLEDCLPTYVLETLRFALPQFGKKLKGFDVTDAVLTGVETRSSAPVRMLRTSAGESICNPGLWVAGEGAGYAGGIMSAATDGLRIARSLIERYKS